VLYERKLQKVLDEPPSDTPSAPEAAPDIAALADSNQNGNTNSDQYSDKEDGKSPHNALRTTLYIASVVAVFKRNLYHFCCVERKYPFVFVTQWARDWLTRKSL